MASVDEFAGDVLAGRFRAEAFRRWVEGPAASADAREHYAEGKAAGMSLEWIVLTTKLGVPSNPKKWEHVKARRRPVGWSITITFEGRPYSIGE